MKSLKNSIFILLGVFVMCLFSQDVLAQENRVRKKGDKIRTEAGKQRVIKGKTSDVKRPAVKPAAGRAAAKKNPVKSQERPTSNANKSIKKPRKIENKNKLRPANRPAAKNNSAATQGRLSGIRKGQATAPRMSAKNSQAMRSGHAKLKGMRTKLNAAKAKVAKEKAANPNSADVKAKEARIRQAEAKIKAMEQELRNQRATITKLHGQ